MSSSRVAHGHDRPSLVPWAWLGGVASVVLAAGAVAAGPAGDTSDVVVVLVGGPVALVLLAAVLLPVISPREDPLDRRHVNIPGSAVRGPGLGAGFGDLGGGGVGGGGSGGGGDCGGAGSSC